MGRSTVRRWTCELTGRYLGGMITSLEIWSSVMFSLIWDANLGVWPLPIGRISGLNSWKRLIPASPPIVEPKVLNVDEADRAPYGREAVGIATEVSNPREYN